MTMDCTLEEVDLAFSVSTGLAAGLAVPSLAAAGLTQPKGSPLSGASPF